MNNKLITEYVWHLPFTLMVILNIAYGFQFLISSNPGPYFMIWSVIFSLLVVSVFYLIVAHKVSLTNFATTSYNSLPVISISILLTCFFYSKQITYTSWYVIAFSFIGCGFILNKMFDARTRNHGINLIMLAFYISLVYLIPHDNGANMLLIIEEASKDIQQGISPYRYYSSAASLPFIYLPGTWIPYVLCDYLGLDYRAFNLACLVATVLIFEKNAPRSPNAYERSSLALYPIIYSYPIAQMVVHGHIWLYWLLLISTAFLMFRSKHTIASIVFGLCLVTRQPAVFFSLPLAIYIFKTTSIKTTIKTSAIAMGLFLVILSVLSIWAGQGFWNWYLSHSSAASTPLSTASLTGAYPGFDQISLTSFFYKLNIDNYLMVLQISIFLLVCYLILKKISPKCDWTLLVTGLGFLLFVLFNSYIARYVYIPGIFLIATGLIVSLLHTQPKQPILNNSVYRS